MNETQEKRQFKNFFLITTQSVGKKYAWISTSLFSVFLYTVATFFSKNVNITFSLVVGKMKSLLGRSGESLGISLFYFSAQYMVD